jgi:probable HAF family extracellular repeat protein
MKRIVSVVFVVSTFFVAVSAQAVVQYTVTDLGNVGGNLSYPWAINSLGEVVGQASVNTQPTVQYHAFRYSNGTMTDLGTLGGTQSYARKINDAGQIVGESNTAGNVYTRAFLFSGGTMTDLGIGPTYSIASCINNHGQIAGDFLSDDSSGHHVYLYNNGNVDDLGNLGNTGSKNVVDINDDGLIVGNYYPSGTSSPLRSFLLDHGVMRDLGTLGSDCVAHAINSHAQIVGSSWVSGQAYWHAFLEVGTTMTDIGEFTAADINDYGKIVGVYHDTRAVVYSNGTMTDLNGLIAPIPGLVLNTATAINNAGQITCTGRISNGYTHAYLLTPIPEPSTFALLGVGAVAAMGYAWRRRKAA